MTSTQTFSGFVYMLKFIFEPFIWILLGLRGDPGRDGISGYGPQGLPGVVGSPGPRGNTQIWKYTPSVI